MKVKIKNLIPDPEVPAGLEGKELEKAQKKVLKQKAANVEIRKGFFDAIWVQRKCSILKRDSISFICGYIIAGKYTNRQSLTSIFYVMVATDETDHMAAIKSTKWSCHPVVRVRRCICK